MVVTRGKYRGIKLKSIKANSTRPTAQKVKEAIFSMLANKINESSVVLDLFSGSGSLGIDCLSSDVKHVVFNDTNYQALKVIKENLSKIKEDANKYDVYKMDYLSLIKKLSHDNKLFDFIFLDPPYHLELISYLLNALKDSQLLNDNGIVCCESNGSEVIEYDDNYYDLIKVKEYGNTKISIFERKL